MSKKKNDHLPLSDSVFYILISLTEPKHGYAVMQHVEEISQGDVKIGPATLYTSLTKLQESKLIAPCDDLPQSDERRKPYALTDAGLETLKNETARRARMAADGEKAIAEMEK